jgi:hypothetical protein
MFIKYRARELELSKDDGLSLVDLIAGVRASVRQGWRPWCEECGEHARSVAVRLAERRCYLSVSCDGHTHRELVEASDVHNATRIVLRSLAKDRPTIVVPTWTGSEQQDSAQRAELPLSELDDVALFGESIAALAVGSIGLLGMRPAPPP